MKHFLLCLFVIFSAYCASAQQPGVSELPAGKYEPVAKESPQKWDRGDIILIDESHYRISTNNEVGEYKFSVAGQRVFFTSGPLKNLYAKTTMNKDLPAIILPVAENAQAGMRTEVWCCLKQ